VVADHILTVVWIALLLVFPRVVGWFLTHRDQPAERELVTGSDTSGSPAVSENPTGGRRPGLGDLVALLALGVAAFVLSEAIAEWFLTLAGLAVPPILILTTLALMLAQFEVVARLRGGQMLGMFGAYLFLAALGAYCEVAALGETGWLGVKLMAFVTLLIVVHGLFVVVAGRLMRQSAEVLPWLRPPRLGVPRSCCPWSSVSVARICCCRASCSARWGIFWEPTSDLPWFIR